MSTYAWSIPAGKAITGSTKIANTDNNIGDTIDDLVEFVNGEGSHSGQGLTYDLVDKVSDQSIAGNKVFTGTVTTDITGNATTASTTTGNSGTATILATPRTIGGTSFDGSSNIDISYNDLTDQPTSFTTGMIMMWSGTSANVPTGWYICDGTNSTPNLIGKFIKGSTTSGAIGGSETTSNSGAHNHSTGDHALSISEMPSHQHITLHGGASSISRPSGWTGAANNFSPNNFGGGSDDDNWGSSYSQSAGNSTPHNHGTTGSTSGHTHTIEPVHYELCYIMKG